MSTYQRPGHHTPNEFPYGTTAPRRTQPAPPQHGDQMNGHTFDARENQWVSDTSPAPQKRIGTGTIVGLSLAAAGTVLALVGIANWVADEPQSAPVTVQMSDDDRFVEAYKDAGYYHSDGDAGIIDSGYEACLLFDSGYTERQVVALGVRNNDQQGNGIGREGIQEIVDLATTYLCPEYR